MTEAAAALGAAQAAAASRLQALLEAAAAEVCPSVAAALLTPREAVKATLCADGPDLRCHAPVAAWRRLLATAEAPADGQCGRVGREAEDAALAVGGGVGGGGEQAPPRRHGRVAAQVRPV